MDRKRNQGSRLIPYDLIGLKINSTTVKKYFGKYKNGHHQYLCLCDCGKKHVVLRAKLISKTNSQKSCGCFFQSEFNKKIISKRNSKHGMSKSSTYQSWTSMRTRCYTKTNKKYPIYGGRGISICSSWESFSNFLKDMGEKPNMAHSLDRIDVNGNYEPSNCRWATQKTQQNNRTNTRIISLNGKKMPITKWAEVTGIPAKIIRQRIDRDRMTPKEALTRSLRIWN